MRRPIDRLFDPVPSLEDDPAEDRPQLLGAGALHALAEPDEAPPQPPPPTEPEPDPEPEPPPAIPRHDGPSSISYSLLLEERPDVLAAYERDRAAADPKSEAWAQRVGGDSPEDYARYWYQTYGRYEGYNQGALTARDNVSCEQILRDRPDVLQAFYREYYGPGNDRHSDAWMQRVGGDTPEAYAKYWYETYGRWEGYAQTDKAAAENIDIARLFVERPDVYSGFFTEFHGPNNDRNSSAWVDRVGGDTVEDYAKYWYVTYGVAEGYHQRPPGADPLAPDPEPDWEPPPLLHDVNDDPWNHPFLFPDWRPPYEGWEPPPNIWHDDIFG